MAIVNRTPKPDPAKLYRAAKGYISPDGVVGPDERRRGDDPVVVARPLYWVEVDLSDAELRAILVERFGPLTSALRS